MAMISTAGKPAIEFARYLTRGAAGSVAKIPDNVSSAQAASVPVAGITALQALRDKGQLQPGQKVLINGASGGVGTFAVKSAKSMGAEVTGVCSTRNVAMVKSLGAVVITGGAKGDWVGPLAGPEVDVDRVVLLIDTVNISMPELH